MDVKEIAALRMIESCGNKGLTDRGNVVVSAAAVNLLKRGLIEYAPRRWVGYKLTSAGRRAIA